jgi:hypothetical protein
MVLKREISMKVRFYIDLQKDLVHYNDATYWAASKMFSPVADTYGRYSFDVDLPVKPLDAAAHLPEVVSALPEPTIREQKP